MYKLFSWSRKLRTTNLIRLRFKFIYDTINNYSTLSIHTCNSTCSDWYYRYLICQNMLFNVKSNIIYTIYQISFFNLKRKSIAVSFFFKDYSLFSFLFCSFQREKQWMLIYSFFLKWFILKIQKIFLVFLNEGFSGCHLFCFFKKRVNA